MLSSHPNRDLAHTAEVPPQVGLFHVLLGHREQHHRHPPQAIAKDDHIIVIVKDFGGFPTGNDLAENAIPLHAAHDTEPG
jgi:hypothetical protein